MRGADMIFRNQHVQDELLIGDIPILPTDDSERGLLRHCSADFYRTRLLRAHTSGAEDFFHDTLGQIPDEVLDDLASLD